MRSFEVEEQIAHLGLEKLVRTAGKFRLLDVGCGKGMNLVRHLRNLGVYAEGIDEEICENFEGAIRSNISAVWPEKGCIPREKEFYDLVVSHQNPFITESASEFRESDFLKLYVCRGISLEEELKLIDCGTKKILSETMRVTKKTGAVVIYPGVQLMERYFSDVIPSDVKIKHLEVHGVPEVDRTIWFEDLHLGIVEDDVSFMTTHRTVVYNPERINPELAEALKLD